MNFQVGDKVIHWNYGMGEIVQLDEKTIQDQQTRYFVIRIRDFSIWVTADEKGEGHLRLPTSANEFDNLFSILHGPGEPLPDDRLDRKKFLSEKMKDGKISSICRVIRDLTSLGKVKKLNDDDRTALDRARNFLLDEWSLSLSVTKAKATLDLGQLLGEKS